MNAHRLLAHFEKISDAPDAVEQLRRFVLDLAVRGKLVEQDSRDEPAAVLLERIAACKKQMPSRSRRSVDTDGLATAAPHELPITWAWVPIREVLTERGQKVPDHRFTYIDVTAIDKATGIVAEPKVLDAADAPSRARKIVEKGDVIYSCVRPTLLNIAVIDRDYQPPPIVSTAFAVLNGNAGVVPRFTWIVLRSPYFAASVDGKTRGQAYPAINDGDFASMPFPLPPLAEQHRIVEKVDELMQLCDRLEASQTERETRRDRLVVSSLSRLGNLSGSEPNEFKRNAGFHLRNLNRLATKPEHIKELRKAILNLAVRGKLVPQEKAWHTQPLSDVAAQIVDCPHSTPKWQPAGKICVRTNQFSPGRLDLTHSRFVSETTYGERIQRLKPQANDILYSREGGILGVACRIPQGVELCLGQRMMLIRPGHKAVSEYLELVLNSPLITEIARKSTTGGAAPRVNVSTITAYPIPLPSLAEQNRIVAKVDELMAICDQLEKQLESQKKESRRLLEALLHEALEGVG